MARRRKFSLVFAPETIEHIDAIEVKYHNLIQSTTEEQLQYTPERVTHNRKMLEVAGPYCATWELRFGPLNRFMFYEIDSAALEVQILAIGVRDRERLFIGGKEYTP
jgi:hypothetical protein